MARSGRQRGQIIGHRRHGLTAHQVHRLYEALGTVAEATAPALRTFLIDIWNRRAKGLPDTTLHRHRRGRLYRRLPSLARDDWGWILSVLPDRGADTVFKAWAIDAGYTTASSP